MTEESRALAYRASLQRRRLAERQRALALSGSATAARAVRESWQSLIDYLRERSSDRGQA